MSRSVSFFVRGTPITQGSKRAFVVNGKPVLTETGGDRLRLWRHAISDEARKAMNGAENLLSGPVAVSMRFYLPKPSSAPKRRRTWPTGKRSGDWDKLGRAVSDGITGVVIADDSLIVDARVAKGWAGETEIMPGGSGIARGPGVLIAIREVGE